MRDQSVVRSPSIGETAFNCPHCRALAKQFWHNTLADPLRDSGKPAWFTEEEAETFANNIEELESRARMRTWAKKISTGEPFLANETKDPYAYYIYNLSLSKCYNCDGIAIWLGERMVYPDTGPVSPPNSDLPDECRRDYVEASAIVSKSPRGAAALLRLALQKLCVALGGSGKNLNDDIAMLVDKGLDQRISYALDIVRVIGNNAVHPGEIDLRDDRTTAERLFELLNLIADRMISQPRDVAEMFGSLPEGARKSIEKRDKK